MGTFTVKVTAVDTAGNVSPAPGTQTITIQAVALETDPADSSKTALVIGGTTGNDTIIITPTNSIGTSVAVGINGVTQAGGPFMPTGHIFIYGQAGVDTIRKLRQRSPVIPDLVAAFCRSLRGLGQSTLSVAGSSVGNVLVGGGTATL